MTSLHIQVRGKGIPIIMLHGWGWHSGIWQPLVPLLEKNFHLFMIDLPGFGKSPVLTEGYTFAAIAEQIFQQTPQKAVWLGWSLGGMLATWVAQHHPDRVSHLVTIASSPKFIKEPQWPGVPLATLNKFAMQLQANPTGTLRDFLELQLRGSPRFTMLFDALQSQFTDSHIDTRALLGGLELLRESDLRGNLAKIQAPNLHIFGSHDTLIPVEIAARLSAITPNSQCHTIQRTGHLPFLTHSEAIAEIILSEFINKIS